MEKTMVEKLKNRNLIAILIALVVIVALLIFVFQKSETLTLEASTEAQEGVLYDVEGVMAYYIDAMSDDSTLLYAHYNQTTDETIEVTCLSCHDIDTLQELFLTIEADAIEKANSNMLIASKIEKICFSCHGSWSEIIKLTEDAELSEEWLGHNPHIGIATDAYPGHDILPPCTYCHEVHEEYDEYNYCLQCHGAE
jgi:hypothetical protein